MTPGPKRLSYPVRRLASAPVVVSVVAAMALCVASVRVQAAGPGEAAGIRRDTVTTMDGVYTARQAMRGQNVFATYCISCHAPSFHTGPTFRSKWYGRPLRELYAYVKREMPKNAPGSMSDEEYTLALAYLLKMNGMPTGAAPLASDSIALQRIRLDSTSAAPSTPGPNR